MSDSIRFLGGKDDIPVAVFGTKASNLHRLAVTINHVPTGFALDVATVTSIAIGRCSDSAMTVLRTAFEQLLRESVSKKVIVRSSSLLEDTEQHQCFGLFRSFRDVASFDSLLATVHEAYVAGQSEVISEYCVALGAQLPAHHLALIVQEQVVFEYSAIALLDVDRCLIEGFQGDLAGPISGGATPTMIQLGFTSAGETSLLATPHELGASVVQAVASAIGEFTKRLRNQWPMPVMVEMGFRTGAWFVVQIRNASALEPLSPCRVSYESRFPLDPLQEKIGLKAVAMDFFRECGLFDLPLHISNPSTERQLDELAFQGVEWSEGPYTVRFSHNTELGLPRLFVQTAKEILPAVRRYGRPEWAVIIHKYIEVVRSFELLMYDNAVLLEHVPGMWESANRLPPDVLDIRGCSGKAWLCRANRSAVIARVGQSEIVDSAPVSAELARQWMRRLVSVESRLSSFTAQSLPLSIHFVEDSSGNWYFLNVRPGFVLGEPPCVVSPVHIVETIEDLKTWNGESSILLRVFTDRGRESDLLPLINSLPRGKRDLFVDCGVLSHPAMVLQGNGIKVFPAYLAHPPLEGIDRYEEVDVNLDVCADPIERIMQETAVYADNDFRMVLDIEPIVQKHLLVVSNEDTASFADLSAPSRIASFLGEQALTKFYNNQPWLFIERGRARFCTSGFANRHAHGHIVPLNAFEPSAVRELAQATGSVEFPSLDSALSSARATSSEYLLFCVSGGTAYLSTPSPSCAHSKRFLRTFLASRARR